MEARAVVDAIRGQYWILSPNAERRLNALHCKPEKSDLGKDEFVLLHTVKVEGRKILIYFWSMVKISINTIFLEKY